MPHSSVFEGFSASPQQVRAWMLARTAATMPCAQGIVLLDGPVDVARLRGSIDDVVRRHEILRTALRAGSNQELPIQVISEDPETHWQEDTLAPHLEGREEQVEIERLARRARDEASHAISQSLGAWLIHTGPERHHLILRLPGWCADAGTIGLLVTELAEIYDGESGGEQGCAAPLQYADVAEWLNRQIGSDADDEDKAFWELEMRGVRAESGVPGVDRCGEALALREMPVSLSSETERAVRALASALGADAAAVLTACWIHHLRVMTGDSDPLVGVALDGRRHEDLQRVLGPLTRYVPVTTGVGPNTLAALIRSVRNAMKRRADRQEAFGWPAAASLHKRGGYFPHCFAFQPAAAPATARGTRFTLVDCRAPIDRFALQLAAAETPDHRLRLSLCYDTSAVSDAAARRIARQHAALIASATANLEQPLDRLVLTSAEEREELIVSFNHTAATLPTMPAHRLFEEQAARHPERPAVTFGEQVQSYAQLDANASALAAYLQSMAVGPDERVAVCMPRRPELLVALLGVLKAGAAFLPIDPTMPAKRLLSTLQDAGARVLLTVDGLACGDLAAASGMHVLRLDRDWTIIAAADAARRPRQPLPEHLAYVIYTSGSTGVPKGVMVTHHGLLNYLLWSREAYHMADGGGSPVHLTSAADMTITCLLGPLCAGQPVVLLDETAGVETLGAALTTGGPFAFVKVTPSHLRMLGHMMPPDTTGRAAAWVIGGEALHASDLEPWRSHPRPPRFINEYGPTETVVGCCTYEVAPDDPRTGIVPIGAPLANTRLYILNTAFEPVPLGTSGELFIGGSGVARGYLGRPRQTAERFVPDPFVAGARLYRTGDLTRRRFDGQIEFLGRLDHQVKLRGHRIELGEIEVRLLECPGVREAVVVVREDAPGQRQLVAYIVGDADAAAPDVLSRALADHLPEHMIPTRFVRLAALPLTTNGKVDRAALPSPSALDTVEPTPPRTAMEQALVAIWSRVLQRDRVGVTDSFFRLGGDSILSLQLVAEAQRANLSFTIPELFQAVTIERLAALLTGRAAPAAAACVEPFALVPQVDRSSLPPGLSDAYPLTDLQGGMLFHSEYDSASSLYHDITSFRIRAPIGIASLKRALEQVVERHDVLRTSFDLHRYSVALQLVHASCDAPLSVEDLRGVPADRQDGIVRDWIEAEKRRPFDWRRPPLFRLQVHQRGDDEFQLSLSFHHAILDGWSSAQLLSTVFTRARDIQQGTTVHAAPPLACRFADFVRLELAAADRDDSRAFWRRELAGATPPPRRPWGRAAAGTRTRRQAVDGVPELSDRLRDAARRIDVPLKSLLFAAHVHCIGELTGTASVVTALALHGRPELPGADEMLGLFLNTLPVAIALGDERWSELARRVLEKERELQPHARYPFSRIKRQVGIDDFCETGFSYTHFRALGSASIDGADVIDQFFFEETNVKFGAHFFQHPVTSELGLHVWLGGDPDQADLDRAVDLYRTTVRAMTADIHASRHHRGEPASRGVNDES